MSPSPIPETVPTGSASMQKPSLYILSEFHPVAVKHADTLFNCIHYDDPRATDWRAHASAILVKDYPITAADIAAAPHLRAIGKQGVGTDQINSQACAKADVRLFNTPGVNASAVAELVLGLTLSVARNIPALWHRQLGGERIRKETCNGLLLTGKTIGVIGMGNIGREVARMFASAFAASVVAFDPHAPEAPATWEDLTYTRARTLAEVLSVADVVSIHAPLTAETRGLISTEEFILMRPTAILINAARGGIVDEEALEVALKTGQIWGAGLDCHVKEPPTLDRYEGLWESPHLVGVPHVGAATDETQIATTNAATDQLYAYMIGIGNKQML
ncbi:hypothetical protein V499_00008 [Pseudogymnoascus sp. VKM F-103]|nr:hypothetical protein V499_00008 [Pseudogymnoascus sp. VKM F-103]